MFDLAERFSPAASARPRGADDGESDRRAQCWFDCDPTPNILAAVDRRVLRINPAGEKLLGEVVHLREGRLAFAAIGAQRAFEAALGEIASRASDSASTILRCDDDVWRRVTILVAPGDDRESVFVVVHGADQAERDVAPLAEAFGLTPTECRVLALLSRGASAKTIAAQLGASPHTIRVHLRSLYGKTNVRGLHGLVREYTRLTS